MLEDGIHLGCGHIHGAQVWRSEAFLKALGVPSWSAVPFEPKVADSIVCVPVRRVSIGNMPSQPPPPNPRDKHAGLRPPDGYMESPQYAHAYDGDYGAPANYQPLPPMVVPGQFFAGSTLPEGSKSYLVTLVLASFFGMFGADHFYLGKKGTGLFKLMTFGGFGIWVAIDVVITLFGGRRDAWGLQLDGYERHKRTVWKVLGIFFAAWFGLGILASLIGTLFGLAA